MCPKSSQANEEHTQLCHPNVGGLGDAQRILQPFHASLTAINRNNFTDRNIIDRSHPLSGTVMLLINATTIIIFNEFKIKFIPQSITSSRFVTNEWTRWLVCDCTTPSGQNVFGPIHFEKFWVLQFFTPRVKYRALLSSIGLYVEYIKSALKIVRLISKMDNQCLGPRVRLSWPE